MPTRPRNPPFSARRHAFGAGWAAVCVAFALLVAGEGGVAAQPLPSSPGARRSVDDYRYFRALTIDLKGRMPNRDEISAFERPSFDVGLFIEEQLRGEGYVDRLTRIYMDALRLDVNPLVQFTPAPAMLYAETIKDESGKLVRVFYRRGQRRARDATDGDFCLTPNESGIDTTKPRGEPGALPSVKVAVLEKATVLVRPWWLYRDYRAAKPSERIGKAWTSSRYFQPAQDLLVDAAGADIQEVRVCREEAQTPERGTLWVSSRPKNVISPPLKADGRTSRYPYDDAYAREHKGEPITCTTNLGLAASVDCGCGVGLERCMPYPADYALPDRKSVV